MTTNKTIESDSDFIIEQPRRIPIIDNVDVLVVGGGMAGAGAALAAGRMGAKTLLVEYYGCLGGTGTSGMVNNFCGFTTYGNIERVQIVQGIGGEIHRNLQALDAVSAFPKYIFNPEVLKYVLDDRAEKAGVKLLYYTRVVDVISDNGTVKGVIIENKGGRQAIMAKRVIDCTGDGDVCAQAGIPFELGDGMGNFLSCDLVFHMINVGNFSEDELNKAIAKALDAGTYGITRKQIIAQEIKIKGAYWVNWANMPWPVNGIDPAHLSKAAVDGRKIVRELRRFLRSEVPGFEEMDVVDTAPMMGLRETRRVIGDHVLTKEEIRACTKFEDGIGACAWPFENVDPIKGRKFEWLPDGEFYTIPYRILLPKGAENLLMAGRFVSCAHEAQTSIRVMGPAVVMGEAAGTAAALSIEENVTPRQINTGLLRNKLRAAGAFLG